MPLIRHAWESRLDALRTLLNDLDEAVDPKNYTSDTWSDLSRSLDVLNTRRHKVLAMLIALAPFDARFIPQRAPDVTQAESLASPSAGSGPWDWILGACDKAIDEVLDAIEDGRLPRSSEISLGALAPGAPTTALSTQSEVLAASFGMASVPLNTEGDFSAARVFENYKYANQRLLPYLLAHMDSLYLEPVDDVLVMVSVCGWIQSSPDAVLARQTLWEMRKRLEAAFASPARPAESGQGHPHELFDSERPVLDDVLTHLARRYSALRQGRRRIHALIGEYQSSDDAETAAHALADCYRRLVEGPVREYAWAMRCLRTGTWSTPPTVGVLPEALAPDAWLAEAVGPNLLPDVRNSHAHESLEWDGHRGVYVVDSTSVELRRVDIATANALSFALGCEAALTHWHARSAQSCALSPSVDEPGRMPAPTRAEAIFGTNGLQLVTFKHNTKDAEVQVARLQVEDINPALQALMHARRLLPTIETFRIVVSGAEGEPPIAVSAAALDETFPVWVRAREAFEAMPLSAFLPANLDSRLRHEPADEAARSVSWIALDDALSSIDELPARWGDEELWHVRTRLDVATEALSACQPNVPPTQSIAMAMKILRSLRSVAGDLAAGTAASDVDKLRPTIDLRVAWRAWGPAARMPLVAERRDDPDRGYAQLPSRRAAPLQGQRWTTL
ncbi:hypothetical protein [Nocardioides sp. NPDC006273]|uniref:hypothetical protein n=1 Tax=Nocardioides sp. NPDC006273 TaxID=3155598 RepID=UPI00339E7F25